MARLRRGRRIARLSIAGIVVAAAAAMVLVWPAVRHPAVGSGWFADGVELPLHAPIERGSVRARDRRVDISGNATAERGAVAISEGQLRLSGDGTAADTPPARVT